MDRFMLRLRLGDLAEDDEVRLLGEQGGADAMNLALAALAAVASQAEVRSARATVRNIQVSEEMRRYMVRLAQATRDDPMVRIGASPRASLGLQACAQAVALTEGSDFVTTDHVHAAATAVLAHRLLLTRDGALGGDTGEAAVARALAAVPAPV